MAKTSLDIRRLKKDLQALIDFASGEGLALAKKAVADPSLSFEDLSSRFPGDLITLVLALLEPTAYELLWKDSPQRVRKLLQQAKRMAVEHLASLSTHPALVQRVRKEIETREAKKPSAIKLNYVKGLNISRFWCDKNDKIQPLVRLGFRGPNDEALLDSTMDWDDLTFLAGALVEVIREEFERLADFRHKDITLIQEKQAIAKRREKMENDVRKIRELANPLGLAGLPHKKAAQKDAPKGAGE